MKFPKISLSVPKILIFMFALLPLFHLAKGMLLFSKSVKIEVQLAPQVSVEQVMAQPGPTCRPFTGDLATAEFAPKLLFIPSQAMYLPIAPAVSRYGALESGENLVYLSGETGPVKQSGGNIGIYGHDVDPVLAKIRKLKKGDQIEVSNPELKATYQVTNVNVPYSLEIELFPQTTEPTLTLVAYTGSLLQNKYIVQAKMISIQGNCYELTQ